MRRPFTTVFRLRLHVPPASAPAALPRQRCRGTVANQRTQRRLELGRPGGARSRRAAGTAVSRRARRRRVVSERLVWLPSLGLDLVVRIDGFAWMFAMRVTGMVAHLRKRCAGPTASRRVRRSETRGPMITTIRFSPLNRQISATHRVLVLIPQRCARLPGGKSPVHHHSGRAQRGRRAGRSEKDAPLRQICRVRQHHHPASDE